MQLYKISQQLEDLLFDINDVIDSDGLVTTPEGTKIPREEALQRLEKAIKELQGTHEKKCLDIACLIKSIEAESEAIHLEEKRLTSRRKSAEAKANWLRSYLQSNMNSGVNVKDARSQIGWRKSTSVDILVPTENLPERFRRTKVIIEADKVMLKEVLKAGELPELQGKAVLNENYNIQIR